MKLLSFLALLPVTLIAQQPDPAFEAYKHWEPVHRDADYTIRAQALLGASTEWTAKWPDSRFAWEERREALLQTRNRSPETWKQVGEALIRLSPPHTFAPLAAYDWVTFGINLREAESLITSEIDWQDAQPKPTVRPQPRLADRIDEAIFSGRQFGPLCTLASAEIQLKEFAAARAIIGRIHSWLEGDFKHYYDPDPFETFPDYSSKYFLLSAQLALAEGRKVDALTFYHRLLTDPYFRREYGGVVRPTRDLWREMGGTDDGWPVFSAVPSLPAGVPSGYPGISYLPWLALDYRLPPAAVPQLQGKTTLVYLWTSSCVPTCGMLAAIQKAYERLKDQPSLQVVVLTVDQDREKLGAFAKDKNYGFPVVVNTSLVNQLLPRAIPGQIWIVDRGSSIRLQRTTNNFIGAESAFVEEALFKLRQVSSATP